uniref:Cystatin domain-containing protein n=2 Tax=Chenopodium quinoa TaxID=63459 RepID=A0A803LTJ4_CHEQI
MVGARTQVKDVKTNKEVQELGKFSVEEYNREFLSKQPGPLRSVSNESLDFVEVVEAQRQVVSGIKYYLKVEAVQGGVSRTFDAVVVVKPWVQESKKLLNFGPSPRPNFLKFRLIKCRKLLSL